MATTIDTGKLTNRRVLHFDKIDQALADAEQIAEAQRGGRLRKLGNWSPGKNFGHLATWVDYSYDGVPMRKLPFLVRLFLKTTMKKRMLYKPMHAGARIPRVPGGTLGMDELPFDEGISRFRKSFTRLSKEAPQQPNLMFGPMTHAEWINLHLRHAELHLSYMRWD